MEAGCWYLPGSATGRRETIVTSPIEALPQYVLRLPGPGWPPFFAAIFTSAFFLLLTVKAVTLAALCGAAALVMFVWWMWGADPKPVMKVDIGGGITLPAYASGPLSHSWWAMVVLLLVTGSLYLAYVFSYLYLWVVSPQVWPAPDRLPPALWPFASAVLLLVSGGAANVVSRKVPTQNGSRTGFSAAAGLGILALLAALFVELWGHLSTGLDPASNAHAAMVAMGLFLQLQIAVPVDHLGLFVVARLFARSSVGGGGRWSITSSALALCRRPGTARAASGARLSAGHRMTQRARPFGDFIACLYGPIIWAMHFFIVYGLEAAVCTRASSPAFIMRWIVAIATAIAIAALAAFVFRCFLNYRANQNRSVS